MLFNIAQSYRLAGESEKAITAYRSFIRSAPKSDQRGLAEAKVRELEQQRAARPPATLLLRRWPRHRRSRRRPPRRRCFPRPPSRPHPQVRRRDALQPAQLPRRLRRTFSYPPRYRSRYRLLAAIIPIDDRTPPPAAQEVRPRNRALGREDAHGGLGIPARSGARLLTLCDCFPLRRLIGSAPFPTCDEFDAEESFMTSQSRPFAARNRFALVALTACLLSPDCRGRSGSTGNDDPGLEKASYALTLGGGISSMSLRLDRASRTPA